MKNFNKTKRPSFKFFNFIRNFYLFEAHNNPVYNGFNLLFVVDMDMKYGWDLRGVLHSFSKFAEWDVVCANGIYTSKFAMHDIFAFRVNKTADNLIWLTPYSPEFKGKNIQNYISLWIKSMTGKISYLPSNISDILVPVDSAFGGMAIYKRKLTQNCFYDDNVEDCDHPTFHRCMRTKHGAKIFLNPCMLMKYNYYKP